MKVFARILGRKYQKLGGVDIKIQKALLDAGNIKKSKAEKVKTNS